MSDELLTTELVYDQAEFAKLAKVLDPAVIDEWLDAACTDLAHKAQEVAMGATPGEGVGPTGIQRTGNARRSTLSDTRAIEKYVEAHYAYYRWLDQGEDSRGRVMLSRPGGYQIGEAAQAAAETAADKVLDKVGREIAARWAS